MLSWLKKLQRSHPDSRERIIESTTQWEGCQGHVKACGMGLYCWGHLWKIQFALTYVKWKSFSRIRLFSTPRIFSPWNSPGQNTGMGSHYLLPRDLPNPGIKPRSSALQADSLTSWATREAQYMKGIRPSWVYFRNARFISPGGLSIICWHIKRGEWWLHDKIQHPFLIKTATSVTLSYLGIDGNFINLVKK